MHKLIINKLGPIEHCELECSHFMTLTGFESDLQKGLENHLREKFLRTFRPSWELSDEMSMEYYFTDTCFVKVSLIEEKKYESPDYLQITLSAELRNFLLAKNESFSSAPLGIPEDELRKFRTDLYDIFSGKCSVVYIPAGRSMITLLSPQLGYIYATMDSVQKQSLDYCTKNYLERILRIKSEFSEGLKGLAAYSAGSNALDPKSVKQALKLIETILMGTYRCNNGEDQIVLENGKHVRLNFASSGQQECVWILNLLFYYLVRQNHILFIIEEPESHLFPESQKYITELIALISNCGHSVVLTTHSPYVLGTLNNLLYVNTLPEKCAKKAEDIIPRSLWLDDEKFDSWFVKKGTAENCMDTETHMIQNERIDEISKVINMEFDKLLDLQDMYEEGQL